jgi:hypothetical protein
MIQTYYAPIDSATGEKLIKVAERIQQAKQVEQAFIRLYGLKDMLPDAKNIVGGITIAEFTQRPSARLWLPFKLHTNMLAKNCYVPNVSTVAGKSLIDEIKRIPVVGKAELLRIVGLPVHNYHVPRVDIHDQKSFIRYVFDSKWFGEGYQCPSDCVKQI